MRMHYNRIVKNFVVRNKVDTWKRIDDGVTLHLQTAALTYVCKELHNLVH